MRWIIANLVTAFWAAVLGLTMTYIASQLQGLTANYVAGAVISIVTALVAANAIFAINKMASPKDDANHNEN